MSFVKKLFKKKDKKKNKVSRGNDSASDSRQSE